MSEKELTLAKKEAYRAVQQLREALIKIRTLEVRMGLKHKDRITREDRDGWPFDPGPLRAYPPLPLAPMFVQKYTSQLAGLFRQMEKDGIDDWTTGEERRKQIEEELKDKNSAASKAFRNRYGHE